jgi:type IV secretory pathway TraG/TraD family ATPase VirD4
VYIRWKEQDLLALSPLNRLLWSSYINELTTTYDRRQGRGCKPVLLLIDEGSRTAIPNLHDAASTVCGRGVSIWLAIQSLDQLSAVYGRDRANILRGNCETQLYYRPNLDETTAPYLEKRLGDVSAYARSQTLHNGQETSEALSERPIPLLASQDIGLLDDEEVIAWHRNYRPLKLKRMDWRDHPFLVKRRNIPPPEVWPLPPLTDIALRAPAALPADEILLDDPDNLVDPDAIN